MTDKSELDYEKTSFEKINGNKFVAISRQEEVKKLLNGSIDSTINDIKLDENKDPQSLYNYDYNLNKNNILKSTLLLTEPDILDQNTILPQLNKSNLTGRNVGAKSFILRN